ncbi:MAG TPA: LysM peptidoglycan-binding domain-containing protein [Cytophagaceae bacterium]
MNLLVPAVLLMFAIFVKSGFASPLDSIGIEKKNGKVYVLHKVEAKETLYSISRKYSTTVDEIKKENPELATQELKIGQVIKVPSKHSVTTGTSTAAVKKHKVAPKETLYSISKAYNLTVQELKDLNPGLDVSNLQVGQELVVSKSVSSSTTTNNQSANTTSTTNNQSTTTNTTVGKSTGKKHVVAAKETLFSISQKYGITVDELKKANAGLTTDLKIGQELNIPATTTAKAEEKKETSVVKETKTETTQVRTSNGNFEKIEETGFAEVIEDNTGSPKFLALHKTAPVGTIIHVTNEANGQKVFVRVIGKLPDNGLNDRVIIKISQKAFERLESVNKRFPVELSYIP